VTIGGAWREHSQARSEASAVEGGPCARKGCSRTARFPVEGGRTIHERSLRVGNSDYACTWTGRSI